MKADTVMSGEDLECSRCHGVFVESLEEDQEDLLNFLEPVNLPREPEESGSAHSSEDGTSTRATRSFGSTGGVDPLLLSVYMLGIG